MTTNAYVYDETFDHIVCRPFAKRIAKVIADHTSLTANHVTLVAGLFGTAAGIGFYFPWPGPAIGAALLFTMMVLDCTDGELARLRGGGTWRGRVLDGVADLATAFSVQLGMLLSIIHQQPEFMGFRPNAMQLFLFCFAAGVSMAWTSATVDGAKQRIKGASGSDFAAIAREKLTLWDKVMFRFLIRYEARIDRQASQGRITTYEMYRAIQWCGPTHHHFAMVVAGLAAAVWPLAPLYYFAFVLGPKTLYAFGVVAMAKLGEGAPTVAGKH